MEHGKLEHRLSYFTYSAVMIGVFLGSIICLILYHNQFFIMEGGLEDFKVSGVLGLPEQQLFFFIMRRRIGQILLFALLISMFSYPVITTLFCFSFGIYYGVTASSLLLKFGIRVAGYLNSCFFPHYIFYFIAVYLWGKWFYVSKNVYCPGYKKINNFPFFVKYFVIFILLILAMLWEIYFQKNILNFFYQYLV